MIAGRYALGRELGRGGMGAVWLGTDEVLGRQVALKRLAPIHDVAHARAEREARLAARLSHPHVVGVYDLVTDGEDSWLVMEYVPGTTLAARISAQGSLSPDELAPVLAQVVEALDAAHQAGIVHRDVKPSNILIDELGSAKLSDFGIARGGDADATLTQTGMLTGSPSYLAPEVVAGRPATPASDAWSLGATAFHALAGRPPYEVGDNVVGTLYRIVHEQPPRTDRAGRLAPLVAGLMTQDAEQRWSLARARSFLAGPPAASNGQTRVLPAVAATPVAVAQGARADGPDRTTPLTAAPIASPPIDAGAHVLDGDSPRRGIGVGPLIAAALVLTAALVLGIVLGTRHHDAGPAQAGAGATGTTDTSPAPRTQPSTTASPSPSSSPSNGPTLDGIRGFVTTYLRAASEDPPRGFAMLTPDYQRRSGGLSGYLRFWGNVRKIHDVTDVLPSLDPLGVSYRYTYTLAGAGKRTENVQLRLVYENGRYLIDAS